MPLIAFLKKRFNRALFVRSLAEVQETRPLEIKRAGLTFVSMVNERDLLMYLLAIKSVYRCIGEGQVCVICDDLGVEARRLLKRHIPGIELVDIGQINIGRCQAGGTWERLLFALDRAQRSYVIQVDSDVLAFPPLTEVRCAYESNRAFTMSQIGGILETMEQTARISQANQSRHITVRAQAMFDRLPDAALRRYIRGSSGF